MDSRGGISQPIKTEKGGEMTQKLREKERGLKPKKVMRKSQGPGEETKEDQEEGYDGGLHPQGASKIRKKGGSRKEIKSENKTTKKDRTLRGKKKDRY